MTYFPVAMILTGYLLLFFQGVTSVDVSCTSTDNKVKINCLLINLEYIKCSWTRPQPQQINYTFHIAPSSNSFRECPKYLQEHGQNVGCRIPLNNSKQRFNPFYTKLSVEGNQSICRNYTDLSSVVKLNPPYNVSVNSSGRESEVCVHWSNSHQKCVNYSVSYKKASGPWKSSTPVLSSPFCLSPVSSGVVYMFQVKTGMSLYCGTSHYWSDWSEQVKWIDRKDVMDTAQPLEYWQMLGFVLGPIILIILSILLCYSERIKVVLVPAAPDPSKSLQDLFKKYNGNVESWVYISRELKDAFEPDYTESPCVVCEPSPTFEIVEGPV